MLNHKTPNKAELAAHRALHREAAQAGKQQAKALRAAVAHWRAYCSPVRDACDLPLQSINLQEPFIAAMLRSLLPVMMHKLAQRVDGTACPHELYEALLSDCLATHDCQLFSPELHGWVISLYNCEWNWSYCWRFCSASCRLRFSIYCRFSIAIQCILKCCPVAKPFVVVFHLLFRQMVPHSIGGRCFDPYRNITSQCIQYHTTITPRSYSDNIVFPLLLDDIMTRIAMNTAVHFVIHRFMQAYPILLSQDGIQMFKHINLL
jgi:hypothetical protein